MSRPKEARTARVTDGWLSVLSSGGAPVFDDDGQPTRGAVEALNRNEPSHREHKDE
jgi:hypothetical protein